MPDLSLASGLPLPSRTLRVTALQRSFSGPAKAPGCDRPTGLAQEALHGSTPLHSAPTQETPLSCDLLLKSLHLLTPRQHWPGTHQAFPKLRMQPAPQTHSWLWNNLAENGTIFTWGLNTKKATIPFFFFFFCRTRGDELCPWRSGRAQGCELPGGPQGAAAVPGRVRGPMTTACPLASASPGRAPQDDHMALGFCLIRKRGLIAATDTCSLFYSNSLSKADNSPEKLCAGPIMRGDPGEGACPSL